VGFVANTHSLFFLYLVSMADLYGALRQRATQADHAYDPDCAECQQGGAHSAVATAGHGSGGYDATGTELPQNFAEADAMGVRGRAQTGIEIQRLRVEEAARKTWEWRIRTLTKIIDTLHLMPSSWTRPEPIESGETLPRYIKWLQVNGWIRGMRIALALFGAIALLFVIRWSLGEPSVVLSDGTVVENTFGPASPTLYTLSNKNLAGWIRAQRSGTARMSKQSFDQGYFSAPVYDEAETRNITFAWLEETLSRVCDDSDCDCLTSSEIGVLADATFFDGIVAYNVRIEQLGDVRTDVLFDDGLRSQNIPTQIAVRYVVLDGTVYRDTLSQGSAFCVFRSSSVLKVT